MECEQGEFSSPALLPLGFLFVVLIALLVHFFDSVCAADRHCTFKTLQNRNTILGVDEASRFIACDLSLLASKYSVLVFAGQRDMAAIGRAQTPRQLERSLPASE